MKPIHLRNVPPPNEIFDHTEFITNIAKWLKPENYLELGVRCGRTFLSVSPHSKNATAVDIDDCAFNLPSNSSFKRQLTDDYFKSLKETDIFDLIFIDADHSHEQSLKDFLNAEKHLIDDGFIILHDTYPFDPSLFKPELCNDCYKTALYIKQNLFSKFEVLTLPFNPGLTLVKKMPQNKQLIYL